jgi:excinuclease ABC subunit B
MNFHIVSDFKPTGDQPEAIKQLSEGILRHDRAQTLLGVTGSGKTFTIANVIEKVQKPTLILSHNKTLAAQLYSEFKQFFPDNAVEYFVSYYDYYQPEAYLPTSDTYIEKDLQVNDEIEKLRLSTTSSLLSGRRDVIVVSSVSCIYGMGNPEEFSKGMTTVRKGDKIARNKFLLRLVDNLYSRTEAELERGKFRVKGDTVDIFLAYADYALRVVFFGDEIEKLETIDPVNFSVLEKYDSFNIFPANIFVTSRETIKNAEFTIQQDMVKQVEFLKEIGKHLEAKRLEERVIYDLEMIKELGYCSGIENYSRYFDGRAEGTRPFCLLDYFPDDFLMVIDESHVTLPQIKAMYGGDRSRKVNLVEYGFRLPAALDNRPLKFEEFDTMINQVIFVSATPSDYELQKSGGVVVEQLIRPTGLLDPVIEVRPSTNQVDDLMEEIELVIRREERVLVTTLTKRMAEELAKYLTKMEVRCTYIHSDVDTLERVEILQNLRKGFFDVLIGVNLLREGLDLPEVSFVAIMDADKEGFLRSERALVQTVGRAARNINGKVIMYADRMTDSMRKTIDETNRRRSMQMDYNKKNNITPTQIVKNNETLLVGKKQTKESKLPKIYQQKTEVSMAADPVLKYLTKEQLEKNILLLKKSMEAEARQENFIEAARLRDQMYTMMEQLDKLGK